MSEINPVVPTQQQFETPVKDHKRSDTDLGLVSKLESPSGVAEFFTNSPNPQAVSDPGFFSKHAASVQEDLSPTPARPLPIRCSVFDLHKGSEDKLTCKTVYKVIKAWSQFASDRLGYYRLRKSECSLGSSEHIEATQMLDADIAVVNGYKDLLKGISIAVDTIQRGGEFKGRIRYICDERGNFWSMASFSLQPELDGQPPYLYLDKLVTSGPSLPLNSPVAFDSKDPKSAPVVIKGAGVLMMCSLYQTAQKLGLSEIRLRPLNNSVKFYENIGMNKWFDSSGIEHFSYSVTHQIPKYLADYLEGKNIVATDLTGL